MALYLDVVLGMVCHLLSWTAWTCVISAFFTGALAEVEGPHEMQIGGRGE